MKDCIAIYHEYHKKLSWKQCQNEWYACDDDKMRSIVITDAINYARTIANEENVHEILNRYSIIEVQEYFGYTHELVIPPMRPYLLYGEKSLTTYPPRRKATRLIENAVRNRFSNLQFEIQMDYFRQFYNLWMEFDTKLKRWKKKNQNFFDVALVARAFTFTRETNKTKKQPRKKIRKFVEVCMPYTNEVFSDEPKPLPLNIPSLLQHVLGGRELKRDKCNELLEKISIVLRRSIEEQVWSYKAEYKLSLLRFVAELSESKLRVFLGYKRKCIYKRMSEDIFYEDYPPSKYPVFKVMSDTFLKRKRVDLDSSQDSSFIEDFDPVQVIYDSLENMKTWGFNMDSSDSEN